MARPGLLTPNALLVRSRGFIVMSKQRIIKDEIWDDEWFYDLDPSEKLVWVFLLTNPRCNIAGIYQINFRWASNLCGLDQQAFANIVYRFLLDKRVETKEDWLIIRNHYRHQSNNPKVEQGICRILNEIPPEVAILYPIHSLSIDYRTLLNSTLLNLFTEQSSENNKDMGWNRESDETYQDNVVDYDGDGSTVNPAEERKAAEKKQNAKFRAAVEWLIEYQDRDPKRTSIPKQLKAVQKLYTMGVSAKEAKQVIKECEASPQWQGRLEKPDYWTVVSVIQKRG